ncbi:MAG: hypothetical protein AB4426_26225 [Xenococcaceae cyanobacterium]
MINFESLTGGLLEAFLQPNLNFCGFYLTVWQPQMISDRPTNLSEFLPSSSFPSLHLPVDRVSPSPRLGSMKFRSFVSQPASLSALEKSEAGFSILSVKTFCTGQKIVTVQGGDRKSDLEEIRLRRCENKIDRRVSQVTGNRIDRRVSQAIAASKRTLPLTGTESPAG